MRYMLCRQTKRRLTGLWFGANQILLSDHCTAKKKKKHRLQFQHGLLRIAFDVRIVLVPLKLTPGAEVLDIGTGKGELGDNPEQQQLVVIDYRL